MKFKTMVLIFLLFGFACQTLDWEEKIHQEIQGLSASEILARGKALMEQEKWREARVHFRYIYENFPNSPESVEALIHLADSLYHEGGLENLLRAKARYEDFFNRFPQSPKASYALFMLGVTTFKQHLPPDRDQQKTKEALKTFKKYLDLYPNGKERKQVEDYLRKAEDLLAEHEYLVAYFYYKQKAYQATLERLAYLWDHYPDSTWAGEAYKLAGRCYQAMGDEELATQYEEKAKGVDKNQNMLYLSPMGGKRNGT